MSAFGKTIVRMFLTNKGRFIANFAIVFLSLAITSGLYALPNTLKSSYVDNYENYVPDIILKCKSDDGFSQADIDLAASRPDVESCYALTSFDLEVEGIYNRIVIYDFETMSDILPSLVDGRYPRDPFDIVQEQGNLNIEEHPVGSRMELGSFDIDGVTIKPRGKVVGTVDNALYNSQAKERAMLEGDEEKYISAIYYTDFSSLEAMASISVPKTDIYLRFKAEHAYLEESYDNAIENKKSELLSDFGEENVEVLTLKENTSYALYEEYTEKIIRISFVFPIFFLALCGVSNFLIITKLIKEERPMLATYASLGVGKSSIALKYSLFSVISLGLGATGGYLIGTPFVPALVYPAYAAVFQMGAVHLTMWNLFGMLLIFAMVLIGLGATIGSVASYLRYQPATLMQEKSPLPGKKILLERIPALWNRIAFSWKNSIRNVFRKKKNLILTSLAIGGSTLLLLIGFGLRDVSDALMEDDLFGNVASSMGMISLVIVFFALALAITVVYALTNMNIADRHRELATLKVLGYFDPECSMYAFRELAIISLIASIVALPISVLIMTYVFRYLKFGDIADVKWYTYIIVVVLVNVASALTSVFLYPLVKSIDMNASLKSVE